MAAFDTTHPARDAHGFVSRIAFPFTALVQGVLDWNDARATRVSLQKLSDRELDDIGLSRSEIETVCSGRR